MNHALYKAHRNQVPIIGICGGYQILGQTIEDMHGVESKEIKINGLGLLEVKTQMAQEKTTRQATGKVVTPFFELPVINQVLSGYEIHMGETTFMNVQVKPFMMTDLGDYDGAISDSGNVMGTYYHGIFDNDAFRHAILERLRREKGIDGPVESVNFELLKDREYDRLATHVEAHLDMDAILKLLEQSR
jgi:adenosylcobyric acid synthase